MTNRFPTYTSHSMARCFKCGGMLVHLEKNIGNTYGDGEHSGTCKLCHHITWYNIKKEDTVKDLSGYKELGYVNGWAPGQPPEEYRICKEAKHDLQWRSAGRCVGEYWCEKCQIKFSVDSSD